MRTYSNIDPACPPQIREQLDRVEGALRGYVMSRTNPGGGACYYDDWEGEPWRLVYADGGERERFATAAEAEAAAREYADLMDAEAKDIERYP
jgi:hypothetical protein